MDVADIPAMIIVGHVEGRRAARCSDVATSSGGGATQRHSLSTCQWSRWCPGFAGRRRRDGDKAPVCAADNQGPQNNRQPVFVGKEEDQAQELAVDAARGRHARRQESHVSVVAICVTIVADLVGSGVLEDVIRVVRVAELALMLPYLTSADEIVAKGDGHQQIGLLRHADVADFEIGAAVALTREHPLVSGAEMKPASLQMRSNARKSWSCAQVQLEA